MICIARVVKMGILETVPSGTANSEGRLQAPARHALDVDENQVLEGHPSAARQPQRFADLLQCVLFQ